jgi:hypothetical protein
MVTKIIWFQNLRHSAQLNKYKYVELMGEEKGYNSCYVYGQVKG